MGWLSAIWGICTGSNRGFAMQASDQSIRIGMPSRMKMLPASRSPWFRVWGRLAAVRSWFRSSSWGSLGARRWRAAAVWGARWSRSSRGALSDVHTRMADRVWRMGRRSRFEIGLGAAGSPPSQPSPVKGEGVASPPSVKGEGVTMWACWTRAREWAAAVQRAAPAGVWGRRFAW